ncbi:DoxX family membrane protein [Desulfosporosinus sp. BICA1-9]|uniref:DoxX family membrane protein n=1 Tax=Desulfosporosinus sp. BICA1-9 TaxID=1531958 RepID=UPI00054B1DD3|nr:DoxX family membrane protein [Desulfosporosinus sp. BICA1-9]KJS50202.1 MAG: DoxX family protein [Peptococcaceae bacterium BRH_c23]KJS89767.1 MAG: DoxX family protein [Desulfosporosinus sp. BICA1-9]HBW38111.1 DoxX family membrane protein [Desulfosporosinus sp.]
MAAYFNEVKAQLKDGKVAFLVIIFTLARLIYGWAWIESGLHKIAWFSDGKLNSAEKIGSLITNIAGEKVTRFDPLNINEAFAWIAQNVFLSMPGVTDTLVVILEILVGVFMILGFRIFWSALIAMFMNLQFLAGGSFNNFGYIWTNLAMLKFARYAELLGVDGFLRYRQNKNLLEQAREK